MKEKPVLNCYTFLYIDLFNGDMRSLTTLLLAISKIGGMMDSKLL